MDVLGKEPRGLGLSIHKAWTCTPLFSRTYTIFIPTLVTNRFRPSEKKAFFFLPSPGMQPAGRLHLHLHLVLRPVPFPGRPRSVSPVLSPLISLDTHFILRHQTKDVTIDRCLML
jgi:hypothetical protein